jgi:hypothetical protein
MNPSAALQAAIRTALLASGDLQVIVGTRVYANVSQGQVMPFVTLDEVTATDWSAVDWYGRDIQFDVHAWGELTAAAGGLSMIYDVLRAIELALRDARLTLTGSALVLIRLQSSRVMRDPDGRTLHGVATFRALTQEN